MPLKVSAIFCFLFGLIMLCVVQGAGDGIWYFYAHDFLNHQKLYSELHLIQQPVFILLNALGISLFGDSYYGQKSIFVFVLLAYVILSYLIINRLKNFNAIFKMILLLAFFFSAIHFSAHRFDDYHALTDLFAMGIYLLTLKLISNNSSNKHHFNVFLIGILISLSILTRTNDGLMLLIAISFILLFTNTQINRLKAFGLFFIGNAVSVSSILFLLRETPSVWLTSTIINASNIKGGNHKIFLDALIMEKIKTHAWKVVYTSDFGNKNHWFLINTHPLNMMELA